MMPGQAEGKVAIVNGAARGRGRSHTIHPAGVATDMILNEATFRLLLPDAAHPTQERAAV
jgi:hypothetical protein